MTSRLCGKLLHRWVWNLRYAAPFASRHEYPIAAVPGDTPRYPLGPTALPGQYSVRLAVDGKTYAAPLLVKMDPRVKISEAGLETKFETEMKLSALMSRASEAVLQAGSMRNQLEKVEKQASGSAKQSIADFQKKLAAILGGPSGATTETEQITLGQANGQVTTLYGQIWQVDAAPTAAQLEAVASTERDLTEVIKQWNSFRSADLGALNRELRAAGLPELEAASGAYTEEGPLDEE